MNSRIVSATAAGMLALGLLAAGSGLAAAKQAVTRPVEGQQVVATVQPEEHRFSGSSTSAEALQEWIKGRKYVEPEVETRDLVEFKVNEWQTARAGDVIFKDDQGRFWIKQHAVVK